MTVKICCPREAGNIIREGGLVAFPTETVFGLGADASNPNAIRKLFEAKGRPSNNPLIVHLSEFQMWSQAASKITPHAKQLLEAFSPGPITVVLPKVDSISKLVTAGLNSVGLRVPKHPVAAEILQEAGVPVAAPSANRSGRPSSTTWRSVLEDLDGRIDAVFCKDSSSIGIESTVVDCRGETPIVLRPGAITIEQIRELIPTTMEHISGNREGEDTTSPEVSSPGLLHPHYQPNATVHLIDFATFAPAATKDPSAYCGMSVPSEMEGIVFCSVYGSVDEYAAGFYEFLREVDRKGIPNVYVEMTPNVRLGRALLDRQRRAAGQ